MKAECLLESDCLFKGRCLFEGRRIYSRVRPYVWVSVYRRVSSYLRAKPSSNLGGYSSGTLHRSIKVVMAYLNSLKDVVVSS